MDWPCLPPPALAVKCWTAGIYQQPNKLLKRARVKVTLWVCQINNSMLSWWSMIPQAHNSRSQQRKTQPTLKVEQTVTVVHIPLLSQHGSKLLKNSNCNKLHASCGWKHQWWKTCSLHFPNTLIICLTFLLFMSYVAPGAKIGVRKWIKHPNIKNAHCLFGPHARQHTLSILPLQSIINLVFFCKYSFYLEQNSI